MRKTQKRSYQPENITRIFCLIMAAALFLWAFCNELTFAYIVDPVHALPLTIYQWIAFFLCCFFVLCFRLIKLYGLPSSINNQHFLFMQWIVLSVGLPLLAAEMILDPFYEAPEKEVSIFVKDSPLGWRLKPNYNGLYGDEPVRINALGLRGDEVAHPKPDDSTRILFLGDSVTFGLRIQEEKHTLPMTTSLLIEREMNAKIEAVNAGVPGYNSYQEYLYFKDHGLPLQPDIVVLCFVLNDVLNTYTQHQYNDYGSDSPIAFLSQTPLDSMLKQSSLVQAIQYWKHQLRYEWNTRQSAVYDDLFAARSLIDRADHDEIKSAWDITTSYLLKISQLCREKDIPFLIVMTPYRFQYKEPGMANMPQVMLADFTKRQSIPFLDVFPALLDFKKNSGSDPSRIFQDYCHLTEEGIHIVSAQIAQFIIQHTMLKQSISKGINNE